jgi:sarcosine oxidase subunit beta
MQNIERSAQVAIIGAGITGLAIAARLLEAGTRRVVVYEKSGIGAGASGVQPGGVRLQWSTKASCLLALESIAFYRELSGRLEVDDAPVLEPCGYLFLAHEPRTLTRLARDIEMQRRLGISSSLLKTDELGSVAPTLETAEIIGASFCADDGYFDRPQAVVEAFAEVVTRRGGSITVGEVGSLSEDGEGWRLGLLDGRRSSAEHVVLAAGYESTSLLATLGIGAPIVAEPKYLFYSEPISQRLLEPLIVAIDKRFAAKQLANGRVLASDLSATGDPRTERQRWRHHVRVCIEDMLPELTYVPFDLLVEGYYDVTPDHQPILGPVDPAGRLWLAAGFSGHGFMIAPAVARLVTDALVDRRLDPLLDAFSLERFAAGLLMPELQIV